ncbi:helix-hairpin-helix domain-containing protein [Ornithinibacillus sp. FSL M8-0202]|uniref:helix-hairpin-helix domain-containing protein n=1 Tax=unclassified Ornithinibacillus TaxID=2620869 RepID=UPI0030CF7A7D
MSSNPKLPLTLEERVMLRKAKVKLTEIRTLYTERIASLLNASIDRARIIKGLAEFQTVPSIGYKLAEKLVYQLNIYSLNEIKDKQGAQLFDELEQQLGVWTDGCVEDQIRCVVYYANHPTSKKQWFDFTHERKKYREKNGYPANRPQSAWYD